MGDRFLKRSEVEERLSIKTTALYAAVRRGTVPPPIALGPRCMRWSERELEQRIRELKRETGDGGHRAG